MITLRRAAPALLLGAGAVFVVSRMRPVHVTARSLFTASARAEPVSAAPALDAFGESGDVNVRFALPDDSVNFPLELTGSPDGVSYAWVRESDSASVTEPRALDEGPIVAPSEPGFYRMAILRGDSRTVLRAPLLAVKVPFAQKMGAWLNGYHIGTYLAERMRAPHAHPDGFVEVDPSNEDTPVSEHFRLSDFITHDAQGDVWPKYVALEPRLLDKLELVIAALREKHAGAELALGVHSGFRTPAHNAGVRRAASDSRHQYGDAADVVIDANGDGRIDLTDEVLVAAAVEQVEDAHPDLVGGLGLYTSRRYRTPYVHIDARGRRTRWRG